MTGRGVRGSAAGAGRAGRRWGLALGGLAALGVAGLVAGDASADRVDLPPVRTVEQVDIERYLGVWYEIASYPQRFQKGCTATTATYSMREDGQIQVVNRCRRDSLDGRETEARGRAKVADRESNARLRVTFFWPFWGDYWIIELDPEYRWAVVGHPKRKYLWVLSRTRTLEPEVYEGILERIAAQGYDLTRLQRTLQPPE